MTCQCGCGRKLRADNRTGYAQPCRHRSPQYRQYMATHWRSRDRPKVAKQTAARHRRWLQQDIPPAEIDRIFALAKPWVQYQNRTKNEEHQARVDSPS